MPVLGYVFFVAFAFMLGIVICDHAAREMGVKDPSAIVWDEFIGMWVTLFLVPVGWYYIPLGFLLFRFFDIFKPWPVNYLDQHIGGGFGIMADDVAAGLYAFGVLQIVALAADRFL